MEIISAFITAASGALITGLFGVILYKLQHADASRKENREKQDERLKALEEATAALTEKLAEHDKTVATLTELVAELRVSSEINGEGVKNILRYMLQRYHAEYMLQGFVTSTQKREFLDAYKVYHDEGGNGTGEGWKIEVCELPVRDDVHPPNPYLELMKKGKI